MIAKSTDLPVAGELFLAFGYLTLQDLKLLLLARSLADVSLHEVGLPLQPSQLGYKSSNLDTQFRYANVIKLFALHYGILTHLRRDCCNEPWYLK